MNDNQAQTSQSEAPEVGEAAAQVRVTSDELAQALARIEARKEAESRRLSSTIPLGQAVEELGLEVSPEELLAEVRTVRQNPPAPLTGLAPAARAEAAPDATASVTPLPVTGQQTPGVMPPLTHCPACSRKLLTQASALCNWCGARIDDPRYQEQAAQSRQQLDRSELSQLETMVLEETRYGVFGRLKRRAKAVGNKPPLG